MSILYSILDCHCRLGHPFLPTLKLFSDLGQISSIECECCQLGKHHRVFYHSRVSKMTDNAFLNGILDEEVYMEQLSCFVAQGNVRKRFAT